MDRRLMRAEQQVGEAGASNALHSQAEPGNEGGKGAWEPRIGTPGTGVWPYFGSTTP